MGLKNGFRGVKLRGSPLFIDTMGKSWSLDENNSDAPDCAIWQALISCNTSSVNTTSAFRSNEMLPCHQSMPHQHFDPIESYRKISQRHIISQCHITGPIGCCHVIDQWHTIGQCHIIIPYMWTVPNTLLCSS